MEYILKETKDEKITVRDLQLEVLKIMDELDRVCRKSKIPYALHAGSALGIVNYEGFIPWDDDIDVIVPKEYYLKLISALKKDLKKEFTFQCYETDARYNVLINNIKIRKMNTYIKETNTLLKNRCSDSDGVFVDIIWYGNVSENKLIDEFERTRVKLLMPLLILLDNFNIDFKLLKRHVLNIGEKYSDRNEESKLCSQTVSIPWEKFMKEPCFLKEDIYPFKEYNFEGRKYFSYNNIPNVVTKWYGPKCMKQWNGKEYVDIFPEEKRCPKHCVDINLKSNHPTSDDNDKSYLKYPILLSVILFIVSILLLNNASLFLTGIGIVILGISLMIFVNK